MDIENKGRGLNLFLQVLDGILSHNGEMINKRYEPKFSKDWSDFEQEYKSCFSVEGFIRLSIGLESVEDIVRAIEKALICV